MRTRQTVTVLPIEQISPSPSPVRDQLGDLDELIAGVREHGILTPLLVTEHPREPDRYWLLSGRRRFAAALVVGHDKVPVIVRHGLGGNTVEQLLIALAEDTAAPLGAETRAHLVSALLTNGLTVPQVVHRTGLQPATIAWLLSLLDLDGDLGALTSLDSAAGTGGPGVGVVMPDGHFNAGHPLADAASRRCRHRQAHRIAGVACGPCWEKTIVSSVGPTAAPTVDESAVTRAVNGEPIDLSPAEKVEAVRILTGHNKSAREIAERLRISVKTVHRARATAGLSATTRTG